MPSWGATVTGARKFLIAYNVNLISTKEQAHRVALDIREQGRGQNQVHAGSQLLLTVVLYKIPQTSGIFPAEEIPLTGCHHGNRGDLIPIEDL